MIQGLPVLCTNSDRECDWVGTVGTLGEHVIACEFAQVSCPNLCGETDIVRRQLDEHLEKHCPNREYICEHCGKKGTYSSITQIHEPKCEKKVVPCPKCNERMENRRIEEHIAVECECHVVPCKYQTLGCDRVLQRREMAVHEQNDQSHLHVAINTMVKLQSDLHRALERVAKLENDVDTRSAQLKELKDNFDGKAAKTERELITIADKVPQIENNISSISQSQLEDKHHLAAMTDKLTRLEQRPITLRDGERMTFRVNEYERKRQYKVRSSSPSFYTSSGGYLLEIAVHFSGEPGTHVSIYAKFLPGENYEGLKWPFVGEVMFTLLNQLKDDGHHRMKLSIEENDHVSAVGVSCRKMDSRGISEFIPHAKLEHNPSKNTQYLKDDCLYFRVSVKVLGPKPWLQLGVTTGKQ